MRTWRPGADDTQANSGRDIAKGPTVMDPRFVSLRSLNDRGVSANRHRSAFRLAALAQRPKGQREPS